MVQDLHEQLAKFRCISFSIILFPSFESSKMFLCSKRKSNAETARALAMRSHSPFGKRLLQKLRKHRWCKLITVSEAYTSKPVECVDK